MVMRVSCNGKSPEFTRERKQSSDVFLCVSFFLLVLNCEIGGARREGTGERESTALARKRKTEGTEEELLESP